MKLIKEFYRNRYFKQIQTQTDAGKAHITYPLDFSGIKTAVIVFSEGHVQKGLVPIIKSNIQKNWKWMDIYLIHCGKFAKEELNFWGFLNEPAGEKFRQLKNSMVFSLLSEEDHLGKYLLTIIPSSYSIGIHSEYFNREFCNIVLKSSRDFSKHPNPEDGAKLFDTLLQFQKATVPEAES